MNFTLKIWRQANRTAKGHFVDYKISDISPDASFLEMLDILNEQLVLKGEDPVYFDHDCREGICGACSLFINGRPHGKGEGTTTCQLYMRKFKDGETITVEPFRSRAFPVIKDLTVDRSAFDKIIQAGGYVSCHTGGVPDGNAIPVPKADADRAMDAAACIGCGACVAACKNSSAMLLSQQRFRSLPCCRKARLKRLAVLRQWWLKWMNWVSAIARTPTLVRRFARNTFPYRTLRA